MCAPVGRHHKVKSQWFLLEIHLLSAERKDIEGAEPWLILAAWRAFETRNWLDSLLMWIFFLSK